MVGLALLVITTSSVEGVHPPFEMVHLRVALAPATNPVTVVAGSEEVVMTAVPLTTLHAPVPKDGVFPARVAVDAQTVWSGPALAVVIPPLTFIVTSSNEAVQGALLMVHLKVLTPLLRPLTEEVALFAFPKVPVPAITVQVPVPTVGELPANVVEVAHID